MNKKTLNKFLRLYRQGVSRQVCITAILQTYFGASNEICYHVAELLDRFITLACMESPIQPNYVIREEPQNNQ